MTADARPLISVVIPTYNQASLLKLALQSVQKQSYQNWEAIVINNFSSDSTEEVVTSFQDPRISLIHFTNNGVIAASRNLGIQKAKGELIAFLDSDDLWYPEKLSQCLEVLQNENADAVCHNEWQIRNGERERILRYGPEDHFSYLKMLFEGNCVSTSALLIRRVRLIEAGLFSEDKSINTAEDYDLWMRLARNNCKFIFIQKELGDYLIHSGNNSGAVARHFQAVLKVVQNHYQALTEKGEGKKDLELSLRMRIRTATLFYGAARQAQAQGLKKESFSYFLKSLSLNPFAWKTLIGLALLVAPHSQGRRHA